MGEMFPTFSGNNNNKITTIYTKLLTVLNLQKRSGKFSAIFCFLSLVVKKKQKKIAIKTK